MRTLIVALTATLAITSTASFAGTVHIPTYTPTFYTEFDRKAKTVAVTQTDTKPVKIIAAKAKKAQDASN